MIVRIDTKAWGVGGSNLNVGLTLSVLISNFDSPLGCLFITSKALLLCEYACSSRKKTFDSDMELPQIPVASLFFGGAANEKDGDT